MTADSVAQTLYKVLVGGASCHGGSLSWPLPTRAEDGTWTPGRWVEVAGPLALCKNGLHLTSQPAYWWRADTSLYLAEYDGEIIGDVESEKVCVRRARLLREADWSENQVYLDGHQRVTKGLARAFGNATVRAFGNATVRAYDNATVEAFDNATVEAYGNATIRAYGNATIWAYDNATVEAYGNATIRAYGNATVQAYGNATVEAYGNATVRAYDNATVEAYGNATIRAYGNATIWAYDNATVEAFDNATVISHRWHSDSAQVALHQMAAHIDRRGEKLVLRSAEEEQAAS